jgi:uncharacterized membrane protein
MNPEEIARRKRCHSLELAAILGVALAIYSAIDRFWPAVALGVVGAIVLLVVRWRLCHGLDRES